MKLKETLRRVWRTFEARADAADYDPLGDLTAGAERLERTVSDVGKRSEISA
jgi:hypothetical protein